LALVTLVATSLGGAVASVLNVSTTAGGAARGVCTTIQEGDGRVVLDPRQEPLVELLKQDYIHPIVLLHDALCLGASLLYLVPQVHALVVYLSPQPKLLTNEVELVASPPELTLDCLVEIDVVEGGWWAQSVLDELLVESWDVKPLSVVGDYDVGFVKNEMQFFQELNVRPAFVRLSVPFRCKVNAPTPAPLPSSTQSTTGLLNLVDRDVLVEQTPSSDQMTLRLDVKEQNLTHFPSLLKNHW
jgi:hypothetical protein